MRLLSSLRSALQRPSSDDGETCRHVNQIRDVSPGSTGCEQCLAVGDTWVHLRMCMTCGQVGCCDSSKNKHAHRHADDLAPDHQIMRSLEPGEYWLWCFADEMEVEAPPVR